MRYFRLLKDTPEAPKDSVYIWDPDKDSRYVFRVDNRILSAINRDVVENKPTWFIEVFPEYKSLLEGGVPPVEATDTPPDSEENHRADFEPVDSDIGFYDMSARNTTR